MRRYFFDLQGEQNIEDQLGLLFGSDLAAFKSAEKTALHLSSSRPRLRGHACIAVKRENAEDGFYVSV
jgi:hypothetical protein